MRRTDNPAPSSRIDLIVAKCIDLTSLKTRFSSQANRNEISLKTEISLKKPKAKSSKATGESREDSKDRIKLQFTIENEKIE
jgi:hypothetical protein